MTQPSLLDWQPSQGYRHADPETSRAAAADAARFASAGRLAVLGNLDGHPMTDFELAAVTGRQQTSVGKRRGECRDRGLVEMAMDGDRPMTRPAPSGSRAIVWKITAAGRAFHAEHTRRSS